jgi:hypothetical protein
MISKTNLKIGFGKFFRLPAAVIIIILLVIILIAFLGVWSAFHGQKVKVFTEKTEYKENDTLKLQVGSKLEQKICFSSCRPYYIERKNKEWQSVTFDFCPEPSIVENCIEPKGVKAFQFVVPLLEKGLHRISMPVCVGCSIGEKFREDEWLYSNSFLVK